MQIEQDIVIVIVLGTILLLFLSITVILSIVLYKKRQQSHLQELSDREAAYRTDLLRLQNEVQEATLSNISRELHDDIGHKVALSKLHISQLKAEIGTPEACAIRIDELNDILNSLLITVRGISRNLNAEGVFQSSIEDIVLREVARVERAGNFFVHKSVQSDTGNVNSKAKLVLVRILQESISNIMHHAKAKNIRIELSQIRSCWTLSVTDDGRGIAESTNPGLGMTTMRARAESINGCLEFRTPKNGGTEVVFTFNG